MPDQKLIRWVPRGRTGKENIKILIGSNLRRCGENVGLQSSYHFMNRKVYLLLVRYRAPHVFAIRPKVSNPTH
jgi:hypothetical protein